LADVQTIAFSPEHVKDLIKYGFEKIKATVSVQGTLTFRKQKYIVVVGAEKFSRHQSTKVYISHVDDKLLLFEYKKDGIFLGEAICQKPFERPAGSETPKVKENEVELIRRFLEESGMVVDTVSLIQLHRQGLSLTMAKTVYEHNRARYSSYLRKLRQPRQITGTALFNAFMLDCVKCQRKAVYGKK